MRGQGDGREEGLIGLGEEMKARVERERIARAAEAMMKASGGKGVQMERTPRGEVGLGVGGWQRDVVNTIQYAMP